MVIPVLSPPVNTSQWTESGSAYFMFMGGKGCATVNYAGQTDGTNQ